MSLAARASAVPAPMRAALWMVFATFTFSLMTALIRPASAELHPFQVVFLRNLIGLLLMAPFILRSGFQVLRTKRLGLHMLRAAGFFGAMLCWFSAIPHVALVDAIALNFTAPIFITVLAALVLGEKVRLRRWAAIAVGFAGALVVLRPGFQEVTIWSLLVLGDAIIWSVTAILIRILTRTDSPTTIVAHMFLWVTPLSLIPALFVWQTPSLGAIGWLIGLAAVSTAGHVATTRALALAEASSLMPYDYTRLVFAGVIGFFVFHEVPDTMTLVGAAFIIASTLYIAHREARLAKAERAATPRPPP
jgi:drug/metabolite transporter (DMT)-like permease